MRLFLLLAVFVALVAATNAVEKPAPQKRLLGICIFGISWLGDCSPPVTTTRPRPTSTSTSNPTGSGSEPPQVSSTTVTEVDRFTFKYPQPEVPWRTIYAPSSQYAVTQNGYIPTYTSTKRYYFDLQYAGGAPDGYNRRMMTINGQFPGPLIEAYQGDTLEITVNNQLDIPQAIHWHGMRQNGSNSEDGVPGISQCPIPPGGSYTYKFKLESEVGTFWYHSHYGNTMADGIMGGLLVHSRNDPLQKGRDYDEDRVVYLTDWMNDQSDIIVDRLHDLPGNGYRGSPIMGPPDSILINGVGQVDCSKTRKDVKCSKPTPFRFRIARNKRVRFRVINTGSHALIRFSIDRHQLKVVEADDDAIQPIYTNEIPVWPGQRYSVIVKLDRGAIGDTFFMRARNAAKCIVPSAEVEGKAVLQYISPILGLTLLNNPAPRDNPWYDLQDAVNEECHDLDHYHPIAPLINKPPPAERKDFTIWDSAFGIFNSTDGVPYIGFGLNGTSYTNYINMPLLTQIQEGRELNKEHVPSITWNEYGAYDLVLNQHDPSPLAHPFHLHGRPFYIMARGQGALTADQVPGIPLNTVNPPRRDVLSIPGTSWAILRVITDTPGVWPMHCHIGWHLAVGKLGVIVVRPDEIKKQTQSAQWHGLCAGTDQNVIGPGRRDVTPPISPAEPRITQIAKRARYMDKAKPEKEVKPVEEKEPKKAEKVPEAQQVFEGSPGQYGHNATHWWVAGTAYRGKLRNRDEASDAADGPVVAEEPRRRSRV